MCPVESAARPCGPEPEWIFLELTGLEVQAAKQVGVHTGVPERAVGRGQWIMRESASFWQVPFFDQYLGRLPVSMGENRQENGRRGYSGKR